MAPSPPPFQVRTAGFIQDKRYHSTPGSRQGDVMITVFLDGQGFYRNSQTELIVQKNMVGLVPDQEPGVLMADPADPYVHYYCRFNGSYGPGFAAEIVKEQDERFFPVVNAEEIADSLRQMGQFHRRELPQRMGKCEALLAQALVAIAEAGPPVAARPALSAIAIQEYLREHLAEPTDLEHVAAHFRVSKTSLCRAAKRLCENTILQMHEAMKVEWAQALLRLGDLNVSEVAHRVGYGDPFYFSRVFKKHTGTSPKAWAQHNRK